MPHQIADHPVGEGRKADRTVGDRRIGNAPDNGPVIDVDHPHVQADGRQFRFPRGLRPIFRNGAHDHSLDIEELADPHRRRAFRHPLQAEGLLAQDLLHLAALHQFVFVGVKQFRGE